MSAPPSITAEDLLVSETQAGIVQAGDYFELQRLSKATTTADGRAAAFETHKLLALACSMRLAADSVNMPLHPRVVIAHGMGTTFPENLR